MNVTLTDRLAARERPDGSPLMRQSWDKLLFMHWEVDAALLRPAVPEPVEIDVFEGKAYIAVTPFTVRDARPVFLPAIPLVSSFHETNVRTYVHVNGVPGVWFFSLDANGLLAVLGARAMYRLPYFYASIQLDESNGRINYRLKRTGEITARLRASWTTEAPSFLTEPGSREFFLTERYCLYTKRGETLYRARIHHEPWPLHSAELHSIDTNLFEADKLPRPAGEPFVLAGGPVHVDVWPLAKI